MKLITTPDNELQVWDGSKQVGLVDEGDLYALTDYNNVSQRHLVERDVQRRDVLPAIQEWFKAERE